MSLFARTKKQPETQPSAADINEMLYKRNAELSTKNKALSLLGHLYETSILALKPADLARNVSESVREALNYESVSVWLYHADGDSLEEIGASRSARCKELLLSTGISLDGATIGQASARPFYGDLFEKRRSITDKPFGHILKNGVLSDADIATLAERAHLKASLAYPLALGDRVLGMLLVSMNREYRSLPDYEKDIVASIVNVISLAVDKALAAEDLRRANEKLQSLDKLKTEFLSLAAHQLRSPLTAIRGYTSLLLDGSFGSVDEKQKEAINRVYESSTHLTKVVEDLLNVSKIESGGMKYTMAPFDMEKTAKDIATDLSITAEKKGLKLEFRTDGQPPYMVLGDMEKMRQVVLNIVDNAIKYTQQGSIVVSVTKVAGATVHFAVADTGVGIAPDEQDRLFQKFSRGEGGKMNTGGSGLGLYLAKQIVEAHGGHISIHSPGAGKGSTFAIELKAA